MSIIVTGGAGFIGSHVVDAFLVKGYEVIILDNLSTGRTENLKHLKNNFQFINCDISKNGDWKNFIKDGDTVVHLAALADIVPSIQNPENYFHTNVTGTLNVLMACKGKKLQKFIYAASSSCYGIANQFPTPENAPISAEYPYALTKRLGEELVMHWGRVFALPCISLRFFNVYGTRSRTSGTYGAVFGVFLAQKLAGQPFTIVGDGLQTRDFTYVTDVAEAVLMSAESSVAGEIMNVGSGQTISVNEIADLLGGSKVHIPKRPGEPECTFADISKITAIMNWHPKIDIQTGVNTVLEEIDYWKEAKVWTPETISDATKEWFRFLDRY